MKVGDIVSIPALKWTDKGVIETSLKVMVISVNEDIFYAVFLTGQDKGKIKGHDRRFYKDL